MQAFSELLDRLILTASRNTKIALMVNYFRQTPDPARGWALAVLTGELDIPGVKGGSIRRLVEARVDPELFRLSYDYVGDLAETVSLIWPGQRGANRVPPIEDVIETLQDATRAEGERLVVTTAAENMSPEKRSRYPAAGAMFVGELPPVEAW